MTGREGNLRRAVQFGIGRTAGIGLSQNAPNIKTKNLKNEIACSLDKNAYVISTSSSVIGSTTVTAYCDGPMSAACVLAAFTAKTCEDDVAGSLRATTLARMRTTGHDCWVESYRTMRPSVEQLIRRWPSGVKTRPQTLSL